MKRVTLLISFLCCWALMDRQARAIPRAASLPQSSAVSSPKAATNSQGAVEQTGTSDDAKRQTDRNRSDGQRDPLRIPSKRVTAGHPSTNKPNRLPQPSSNVRHSTTTMATNRRQPASAHTGVATNGGPFQNKGTGSAVPAHQSSVVRSNAAPTSPNIVRHRGDNPAVVGGLGNTNSRNAGTLNGARMSHKP